MNQTMLIAIAIISSAQSFSCASGEPQPETAGGPPPAPKTIQPVDEATSADSSQSDDSKPEGDAELGTEAAPGASQDVADPVNASQVTSAEIEFFAECHIRLVELGQEMQVRLADGESNEVLNEEFQTRTHKIINDSPLSEERYVEIAQLTQVDPGVRQRVEHALDEILRG